MIGTKAASTTLRSYHAKLTAELKRSRRKTKHVRDAIAHIEAVMAMLEPNNTISELVNTSRKNKVLAFKRGEPIRLTFQILRQADHPLTVREIAERIFRGAGQKSPDAHEFNCMQDCVRSVLRAQTGKTVAVSEGVWPERWAITRPQ